MKNKRDFDFAFNNLMNRAKHFENYQIQERALRDFISKSHFCEGQKCKPANEIVRQLERAERKFQRYLKKTRKTQKRIKIRQRCSKEQTVLPCTPLTAENETIISEVFEACVQLNLENFEENYKVDVKGDFQMNASPQVIENQENGNDNRRNKFPKLCPLGCGRWIHSRPKWQRHKKTMH